MVLVELRARFDEDIRDTISVMFELMLKYNVNARVQVQDCQFIYNVCFLCRAKILSYFFFTFSLHLYDFILYIKRLS